MNRLTFLTAAALAALAPATHAQQIRPSADTLVIAQSADAESLDPPQVSSRTTSNILQHVFVSLHRVSAAGKIEPYLAESHEVVNDGFEHVFKIKKGVTCHDGNVLKAEDVAYTFNRAKDPANRFAGSTPGYVFSSIGFKEATVLDEWTVKLTLTRNTPVALGLISEVLIYCKPSYEGRALETTARMPIGSGPYRFVEWVRDDRIVIEKVPTFTLNPVTFQRIVWRTIPESSTRMAELLAGNVDIATNVPPDQIKRVDASPNAKVQAVAGTRRIYIGFNHKERFGDTPGGLAIRKPEVRRALQYAIDIPTICESLLGTPCDRATSLVNPPNGNPDLKPYPYDPKTAERLLDEAGYPKGRDGTRFSLKLQTPRGRYINDVNVALAVAQYFGDIGVKVEVEALEFASVYVPLTRTKDAGPLFLLGTGGSTWSAVSDMSDISAPDSGTNYTNWTDPEWFALWPKIYAAKTDAERQPVINEMLKIFYERGPWLLMYFQPDFYGVSNRVTWQARRDERIFIDEARVR
jgi:peptide/nickel transport system substrate-binding protein